MKKLLIAVAAAVVMTMALWLTLGGGAFGSRKLPSRPRAAHAAVTQVSRPQGATVAKATLTSTKAVSKISSSQPKNSGGDENEGQGENEGGGENSEPPGEPTPGHEDPNGQDVSHECPPSCDSANGELP